MPARVGGKQTTRIYNNPKETKRRSRTAVKVSPRDEKKKKKPEERTAVLRERNVRVQRKHFVRKAARASFDRLPHTGSLGACVRI